MTFNPLGWIAQRYATWRRRCYGDALLLRHLLEVYVLRTRRNDRKVDFIICGTQKGGTTALYAYLKRHPELCMSAIKETHFFDMHAGPAGKTPWYTRYHAYFQPRPEHRLLGEATPIYMYGRDTARLLHEYNPALKLIFVLRDPADRAFSHWNMNRTKHLDKRSFAEAIAQEVAQLRTRQPCRVRSSYVSRGFYLTQLERFWAQFPREQTLVLNNSTLRGRPRETLDAVCHFLGIAPLPNPEEIQGPAGRYVASMNREDRSLLVKLYESEIHGLEKALNWDCQAWLDEQPTTPTPRPDGPPSTRNT